MKTKLSDEEKELLAAYENGELVSDITPERRAFWTKSVEDTVKKDKRINIRISSRDLAALQRRAMEEGLPYQTLIASIIHKYVSGGLKDVSAAMPPRRTGNDG